MLQCRGQIRRGERLEHVAHRSTSNGLTDEVIALMHRQEHNLGPRSKSFQFLGCLKSVEARHRDVENDDIGVETGHSVQSFAPVCHRGYNFEFCRQRSRDGLQDPSVVVRQENSRSDSVSLYHAVGTVPPSMTYSVPVIAPALAETTNAMSSATSRGVAGRPSGMPPRDFMMICLPPS